MYRAAPTYMISRTPAFDCTAPFLKNHFILLSRLLGDAHIFPVRTTYSVIPSERHIKYSLLLGAFGGGADDYYGHRKFVRCPLDIREREVTRQLQ